MALTYCTLTPSLGIKRNIGQWDRMFFENLSYEMGAFLCLCSLTLPPLQVCVEDVGGLPPLSQAAALLKNEPKLAKRPNIPLKCTNNWNPMGCSRSACCCDGWGRGACVAVAT